MFKIFVVDYTSKKENLLSRLEAVFTDIGGIFINEDSFSYDYKAIPFKDKLIIILDYSV